jgi:serine phosphatase RsbU (regulator of sigma subunit)
LPTWSQLRIAARQRAVVGNGGDFYEVIQQRNGHVTTVMADICGNGPAAAAPVSNLRWVLRQELARGGEPAQVLATLNDWIVAQQAHDFVTAVCVRVDPQSGRVDIASAGHLGPFVKRANGNAVEVSLAVGPALGILPAQVYQQSQHDLESEDALVLVTDGITDPLGTTGNPLGQAGLVAALERARPGAEAICAALLGRDASSSQDATVIVLQLPRRHRRVTPVNRSR